MRTINLLKKIAYLRTHFFSFFFFSFCCRQCDLSLFFTVKNVIILVKVQLKTPMLNCGRSKQAL